MKTLRMYYLVGGKMNFNIGDNIKNILDEDAVKYDYKSCDWGHDFEKEFTGAFETFERIKKFKKENLQHKNECWVLTSQSGTIRAIIPINKLKDDVYD